MLSSKVILLIAIPVFCALSLVLKENFPFSHYPMYSDPDPISAYYHLEDAEGKVLPLTQLTGVRGPNLGKILRKRLSDQAKKLDVGVKSLPREAVDGVARDTLAYLRTQAKHSKQVLPEKLRIMFTTIQFVDGKVEEKREVFFAE